MNSISRILISIFLLTQALPLLRTQYTGAGDPCFKGFDATLSGCKSQSSSCCYTRLATFYNGRVTYVSSCMSVDPLGQLSANEAQIAKDTFCGTVLGMTTNIMDGMSQTWTECDCFSSSSNTAPARACSTMGYTGCSQQRPAGCCWTKMSFTSSSASLCVHPADSAIESGEYCKKVKEQASSSAMSVECECGRPLTTSSDSHLYPNRFWIMSVLSSLFVLLWTI
eukprot:TRINITY_DN5370_c0_g1_i1.p1 TRINITY_DN5370_c0_g1~~TRINITY_DN5370_c0_g1_i1.p1  ORF type:complete len:224 (+),score=-10.85 TRINITY_DN5370_c0_g1_i1:448-1119(+)